MQRTTSLASEAAGPSADQTARSPGRAKTLTGARTIVDLLANGKRVGVTADSRKVHPDICEFTTEQFYEWRPRAQPELRR